jgi:hypothetical protein
MQLLLPIWRHQRLLQVFPLRQAALSNHKLRVKLVGLHKASLLSAQHNFSPDVYDLGRTMLWIITNPPTPPPAPESAGLRIADPPSLMSKSPLASSGAAAGKAADETKERETKERETKERETKERETKERETKERETKERLEKLRSYDPSLMLLLEWMTEPKEEDRADMMDVLRHP